MTVIRPLGTAGGTAEDPHGFTGGTAVYLRCYPYDSWQMAVHLRALEEHAARLRLPVPQVFLDNGVSSRLPRPQLRRLLARAAEGRIDTVLIPGRWVFSLDNRTADSVTDFLRGAGADVLELSHHPHIRRHSGAGARAGMTDESDRRLRRASDPPATGSADRPLMFR
ncbi:recombinase family protein [Kitasatospora sp. NPDC049258]|uniref:recombinase family protein n=1 Tax=Kitasatospora sp. NPDC049258 TaxID=3155394 RepID=UPI003436FC6E